MLGSQLPMNRRKERQNEEIMNGQQGELELQLSGQFNQQSYALETQLDLISTIVMNIKLVCSLLIVQQPIPSEVLDKFKPAIMRQIETMIEGLQGQDWRNIKVELFEQLVTKYKARSRILEYNCFSNLNQFDRLMHELYEDRDQIVLGITTHVNFTHQHSLDSVKYQSLKTKKINSAISVLWRQMLTIVEEDTFTLERLQNYDPYENNTAKQQSTILGKVPEDHYLSELINCNIDYGPEVFPWIQPQKHAIYVSEAAKVYNAVVPVKIKFIMPGNQDGPVINTDNYYQHDLESEKAILCCPKPFSKSIITYRIHDICQLLTIEKEFLREVELPMKWQFSPDTRLITTSEGRIFGVNCRTTKQKTDRSMYQISEQKVSNRGQIPQPKRQSSIIHMDGHIYIIGGRGPNQPCSKKGFRYTIKEKKWEEIAQSNYALKKPTLCVFQKKFIFKIGGINEFDYVSKAIQMYDSVSNTWAIVRVSSKSALEEVEILEDSLATQINNDQMYVFGGKNTNRFASDSGFVLQITEIRERKKRAPKVAGEFWNVSVGKRNIFSYFGLFSQSNVITYGNCLYTLRSKQCKIVKQE